MLKIILVAFTLLVSYICLFHTSKHDWISNTFRIPKFYITWVGLFAALVWTWWVLPMPYRGWLLGFMVIKLGVLLYILPRKENWRKAIEAKFFDRREIFSLKHVAAQSSTLIVIGIVTLFPFTGKFIDTVALTVVIGYFLYKGYRAGQVATAREKEGQMDSGVAETPSGGVQRV